MSEELDDIVDNLREPSAWFRVIFMLAFAVVLYVIIAPVILVLMTAQALFSVITGSDNSNLRSLGAALNVYVGQILAFLSYNSEIKPFPFSDFPASVKSDESSELGSSDPVVETAVVAEKKVVKKRPATKNNAAASTARKKTAQKAAKKTTNAAQSDSSDDDASN
jgi:hypothetical protein